MTQRRIGHPSPEISIITPTKNRLTLLCEAMDSVQRQSFDAWEHIIVDDGSDDGTAGEIASRSVADPRILYIKRTGDKSGANACRNLGLKNSLGEFVIFLDSDDILASDCLARRVEIMMRNLDLDFAVFDGDVFLERIGDLARKFDMGRLLDDLDRFVALEGPWDTTGPIWRKGFLSRIGGWDENLMSWQDVDLHIRALAARAHYLRVQVVDHHIRWQSSDERISRRKAFDKRLFENSEPCAFKWRRALAEGRALSPARDEALAGIVFHLAEHWAGNGNVRRAWRFWSSTSGFGISLLHICVGYAFLAAMATPMVRMSLLRGLLRRWKILARIMGPTEKGPMTTKRVRD